MLSGGSFNAKASQEDHPERQEVAQKESTCEEDKQQYCSTIIAGSFTINGFLN